MSYPIPKTIGGYEVGSKLATISNSPVHYAIKKGEKFVIKFSQTKELVNEYALMSQFHHHNILPVIDFFRLQNLYASVMPNANGGDLYIYMYHSIINRCYIPEPIIRVIIKQVLEALAYIHKLGFSHRDVKPENIYFMDPNSLYICLADFGFTCKPSEIHNDFSGTPAYQSPEVIQRIEYPCKADCWALGVIMLSLFYNRHPFLYQDNDEEIVDYCSIINGKFTFGSYPRSIEGRNLIQKLLCVNVNDRISAEDALKDPWFTANLDLNIVSCQGLSFVQREMREVHQLSQNIIESNNNADDENNNNNDNDGNDNSKINTKFY